MANNRNKEQLQEITKQLEDGVREIFESGKYEEYLRVMSKFHHYSVNNSILIAMQMPEATMVAGFESWKKNFKRYVKKGERAIKIISPAPYKMRKEMERIDQRTQSPVIGSDGQPVTEAVEVTIPAFRVANVFDVSQTDGEPLPELAHNLEDDVQDYENFMEAIRNISPVPIGFEDTGSADGYYHQKEQRIAIKEGMSQSQTVLAAIHEVAHATLHALDPEHLQESARKLGKDSRTKEVEAESVSYIVNQYYGIDTGENSFGYIASWSNNKELPELQASLKLIRDTADQMIQGIDAKLQELEKKQKQTIDENDLDTGITDVRGLTTRERAERMIERAESNEPYFSEYEKGFILNYANQLDDVEATKKLVHDLKTALNSTDEDEIEYVISYARSELYALPDQTASMTELHEYGYTWKEMYPLHREAAMKLFDEVALYKLYPDGTEAVIESLADLQGHQGPYGVEKTTWENYLMRDTEERLEYDYTYPKMMDITQEEAYRDFDRGYTIYSTEWKNGRPGIVQSRDEIAKGNIFQIAEDDMDRINSEFLSTRDFPELALVEEAAFQIGNRFILVQEVVDGYDYSIYDENFRLMDGGVYDNTDLTMEQAVYEVVNDYLKPAEPFNPDHQNSINIQGSVKADDELQLLVYAGFLEKVEEANRIPYKPLAKVEELEEANYNMIDDVINNTKPRKEPYLEYYVAECEEFHDMGQIYENLSFDEAVEKYKEVVEDPSKRHLGNGLGFSLHDEEMPDYSDMEYPIVLGRRICGDSLDEVHALAIHPLVREMVEKMHDTFPNFAYVPQKDIKDSYYPEEMTIRDLAVAIDDLAYDYDTYSYWDARVSSERSDNVDFIEQDLLLGVTGFYIEYLSTFDEEDISGLKAEVLTRKLNNLQVERDQDMAPIVKIRFCERKDLIQERYYSVAEADELVKRANTIIASSEAEKSDAVGIKPYGLVYCIYFMREGELQEYSSRMNLGDIEEGLLDNISRMAEAKISDEGWLTYLHNQGEETYAKGIQVLIDIQEHILPYLRSFCSLSDVEKTQEVESSGKDIKITDKSVTTDKPLSIHERMEQHKETLMGSKEPLVSQKGLELA